MRSGLSVPMLHYVWQAVDARGSLNYQQFAMACRLVAMLQTGAAAGMSQEQGGAAIRSPQQVFRTWGESLKCRECKWTSTCTNHHDSNIAGCGEPCPFSCPL